MEEVEKLKKHLKENKSGQVAKFGKAVACPAIDRRFKSRLAHTVLFLLYISIWARGGRG
jgi:hypothetical protein